MARDPWQKALNILDDLHHPVQPTFAQNSTNLSGVPGEFHQCRKLCHPMRARPRHQLA